MKATNSDIFRFITCGSVDDGKSTLIGRMLFDSKLIFEDQMKALQADGRKFGTQGDHIDLALLVDGLAAEREQGITIDVAYRYFSTGQRKFIVADTPGHEQYTRNMATGASTASLAVILIDARKGLLPQSFRHSCICSLMGVRKMVLAINKMDAVNWNRDVFDKIVKEYLAFASKLNLESVKPIPLSALKGDNVLRSGKNMTWYHGPTLMEYLETVDANVDDANAPFRMPVQWINRPHSDFRGQSGTVISGKVTVGQTVAVLPGGEMSAKVEKIFVANRQVDCAIAKEALTLVLDRELDISRGNVLADPADAPQHGNQFQAKIIWMNGQALLAGRKYLLKSVNKTVGASVSKIKGVIDIQTLKVRPSLSLELNEIGLCNLHLDAPIVFEPYLKSAHLGSFILIDKITNETMAAGMIDFELRRGKNIHWQDFTVNKSIRMKQKGQTPRMLWFTGLSGAGKSAIASLLEQHLVSLGRHTYLLDGDNVRHGLNKDLGFSGPDRVENIRRVGEVGKLMLDAGLVVIVAFISPFRHERNMVRQMLEEGEFVEIFVNTPLSVCEDRDPKGLYAKARKNKIKNFTGIDSPYEAPENPEVLLDTTKLSKEESVQKITRFLYRE